MTRRSLGIVFGLGVTAAVVIAGGALERLISSWDPPTQEEVTRSWQPSDARLEARDGRLLQEIRIDPTRRRLGWTPLEAISPAFVDAVLHSEDRRFFAHGGVDLLALVAAAWQGATGASRRGASTISMQLVALLDDSLRPASGRRTWREKVRQMRAALALERTWTKAEILEAYLNRAPFRGEVEGVTAAAEALLGKSPHGLDTAESALLAALLRAPSAPPDRVRVRAERLIAELARPVSPAQLDRAAALIFDVPNRRGPTPRLAPHLARRLLLARPESRVVRSTVDADLQRFATDTLARELDAIRRQNVRDGAVVVLDNASGEVLAYVASGGPRATSPHVDGVRARRQAGSTLKPFLYGLALERRMLTPASLLDDSPLEVPVSGAVYRPRNYDESFRGTVTLRTALASSLNVPAVRTHRLLGEPAFVDRLLALGFTGLVTTGDHYGPSLALGSAEVSLLELANAYRVLARGGVTGPPRFVASERSDRPDEKRRVYSEEAAFLIGQILSDREARSATFGLENALATKFWSAVKTGTSREMRDNWCVGYSRRYTVAVWVGNFSGEPMHEVSGISGAAPTWLRVMSYLHRDAMSVAPEPPDGVVSREITFEGSGSRPEWFVAGTEPAGALVRSAAAPIEIVSPVDGAILVLDPDIPAARERLALVASRPDETLAWRLDGGAMGPATAPVLWAPTVGRHRLRLEDSAGRVVDEIRFFVKNGGGRRANTTGGGEPRS